MKGATQPLKIIADDHITTNNKRQLRRTSDSSSTISGKTVNKKSKPDSNPLPDGIYDAVVQFSESDNNTHNIQAVDLIEFISELRNNNTKNVAITDYTQGANTFIETLQKLHSTLKHKGTKNRMMRIINLHTQKPSNEEVIEESS